MFQTADQQGPPLPLQVMFAPAALGQRVRQSFNRFHMCYWGEFRPVINHNRRRSASNSKTANDPQPVLRFEFLPLEHISGSVLKFPFNDCQLFHFSCFTFFFFLRSDRRSDLKQQQQNSPLHRELDAVALLQDLHQCLGVVVAGFFQANPVRQPVGHHTAGVLLDAFVRHGDQGALPHGLTCTPRQAEPTITR